MTDASGQFSDEQPPAASTESNTPTRREKDPRKPRRVRQLGHLDSHSLVRLEIAAMYRDVHYGRITPAEGTKRAFVLGVLVKALEVEKTEARIAALEEALNSSPQSGAVRDDSTVEQIRNRLCSSRGITYEGEAWPATSAD